MKKMRNSFLQIQDSKAFTLIELMLVVIIIGVLAAMVMPRLVGRSEQARITAAKADIDANIALALDMFELDVGHYPATLDELMTANNLPSWKGPYLKKKPKDPWTRDYKYQVVGTDGKDYKLCSDGADVGKTEDDICNE
jgi:general secretion pathway protein G